MHRLIENASLLTLLVVVGLRPLVAESHDSAGQAITAALGAVADPSPLRSIMFDVAILVASYGVLLARTIGPTRKFRPTGLEAGGLLLLAAMVVSCAAAGQKRLAINASLDWICLPALAIALVQLLDRPWRRSLLLAVVLASACGMAWHCIDQRLTMDDTIEGYEQLKADGFWARQGVEIDSPKVAMFEQRLHSREVDGGFGHSNVAGSYLMLCAIAGAGLVLAGVKRSGTPIGLLRSVGGFAALALIVAALLLTRSKGAILSTVIGASLWLMVYVFRRWIGVHRRRAWLMGWAAASCGVLAVVGHGLYHGSLPGSSLNFRWQYWTASAQLIADHPLGVGGENFGRHYTRYKTIESPEEVANPHNLFVQAAAEWGIAGLGGVLLMLVGCSAAVTKPPSEPGCPQPGPPSEPGCPQPGRLSEPGCPQPGRPSEPGCPQPGPQSEPLCPQPGRPSEPLCPQPVLWGVALIVLILGIRIPLIDVSNPAYTYYNTVTTALAWGAGFAVFSRCGLAASGRTSGFALTALPIALFAFVLHDMINFAVFVPGAATTCFALIALAVSTRLTGWKPVPHGGDKPVPHGGGKAAPHGGENETASNRWSRPGMYAAMLATCAVVIFVAAPVGRSGAALDRARRSAVLPLQASVEQHPTYLAYGRAARLDPLDPTPLVELARWLVGFSGDQPVGVTGDRPVPHADDHPHLHALDKAIALLEQARARDPHNGGLDRWAARISLRRARRGGGADAYHRAVESARRALASYPSDPRTMILLADCQLAGGEALRNRTLVRQAVENLHTAVALDAKRPNWNVEVRRLSDRERTNIQTRIDRGRAILDAPVP